jgi:hypothetical protein
MKIKKISAPPTHIIQNLLSSLWRKNVGSRRLFIDSRYNGLSDGRPTDLPGGGDGKYSKSKRAHGPGELLYHPGPKDLAFMEAEDRKYLRELANSDPMRFLEEMTPIENHDGLQRGLDLREALHCTYQKEFMDDVERICQQQGLSSHPAWVQEENGGGGAAATDTHEEDAVTEANPAVASERLIEGQGRRLNEALMKSQQLERELARVNAENQEFLVQLEATKQALARVAIPRLMRIWTGKYPQKNVRPEYRAVGKKIGGSAVGFIAEEVHANKVKRYLAKSGVPKNEHQVSESLSTRKARHYRSYLCVITELVAAQLYTLIGFKAFYVPKHRLSMMNVINEHTQHIPLAISLMGEINQGRAAEDQITQGLHLISRWIDGYKDLSALHACYLDPDDQESKEFQACVEAGQVPDYASIDGHRIPILGLMEVLAASRLLGDTDVLGGGSKNAGFVVESQEGSPVAVRVVKIDAGASFNFDAEDNQFTQSFNARFRGRKLNDKKDLQFGNLQSKVIQWRKLLDDQKQRFLQALRQGYEALQNEHLLDFMIHRRGAFDEATPGRTLLPPKTVAEFKERWHEYMQDQMLPEVYGDEMAALPAAGMAAPLAPFNPKAIGAACCTFAEAFALSGEVR